MSRLRSLLFAPGNHERKLRRALGEPADVVIADLEDSIPPAEKADARAIVAEVFAGPRPAGGAARFVRVNGAASGLFEEDIAALAGVELDGIVLPKAEPSLPTVDAPLVAIIESATGAAGVRSVAGTSGVVGLMLGSVDLALELRLRPLADGAELAYFRSMLVLESALAGLAQAIDGVHVDVHDLVGLAEQAGRARAFGMGGKACIHPGQLPVVNDAFAPTSREIDFAHRVVEAYSEAVATGTGAVALDGRMIDLPVYEQARRLLPTKKPPTRTEIARCQTTSAPPRRNGEEGTSRTSRLATGFGAGSVAR